MNREQKQTLKKAAEKIAEAISLLEPVRDELDELDTDKARDEHSDVEDQITALEEAKTNLENL